MINKRPLQAFLILVLVVTLTACNLPQSKPSETATLAATPAPPSPTPLPPTDTATPEPPTETPTEIPSTATATIVPPTREPSRTPTMALFKPAPHARFDGVYEFGRLVLRIDNNPAYIVPKTVTVKAAPCNEGKGKASNTLTLDPPTYYEIVQNRFYINFGGGTVKISGEFVADTKIRGTIAMSLKVDGRTCTLGPYPWTGSTEVE